MAELMRVVCIGTVMLMLCGGAVGYYHDRGGMDEGVEQIEAVPPDIEASPYLLPLPKLSHSYIPYAPQSPNGLWKHVTDPNLYVLTERESDDKSETKSKRNGRNGLGGLSGNGPSLSIVNPLEVLRQRLLLEIARRRMRQSEDQIQANRELLKTIGKRSVSLEPDRPQSEQDRARRAATERHFDSQQSHYSDRWNRHHAIDSRNA